MTINRLRISSHAATRMAQRNLDIGDLVAVLRFGRVEHRTGAEFYFLGSRDVPEGHERALGRLVGTVVVVEDGEVRTAYRNRDAMQAIRRKQKRAAGGRDARPRAHREEPAAA